MTDLCRSDHGNCAFGGYRAVDDTAGNALLIDRAIVPIGGTTNNV